MAWRSLLVQKAASLRLHQQQLEVASDGGTTRVPLEDITTLVLETPQATLTTALLAACARHNIAVIVCDAAHMPGGVFNAFAAHSRHTQVATAQVGLSEAVKARLWQRMVAGKITGQAVCLHLNGHQRAANALHAMARRCTAQNATAMEARAARFYWQQLFGRTFRRHNSDAINAALNYGYAVLRAAVARSLVAYGLLPVFGVHHNNQLNAFNLADDVLEMLRPVVDVRVSAMRRNNMLFLEAELLDASQRQQLVAVVTDRAALGQEKFLLLDACDRIAAGLASAMQARTPALLPVPELLPCTLSSGASPQ